MEKQDDDKSRKSPAEKGSKKKSDRKSRSRSRSRSASRADKRRSHSRSPNYRRRHGRQRSRSPPMYRPRRRSPDRGPPMRRHGRRGRRSRSPGMGGRGGGGGGVGGVGGGGMQMGMMVGDPSGAYMMQGTMYDPSCYGAYANNGAYMGGYGGYDYGMVQGGYGTATMMDPSQAMMMGGVATEWDHPAPVHPVVQETEEEKRKREAAITFELLNQRAALKKQRDDYKQRAKALKRELKTLKEQRSDLCSGREPPSPTSNVFIKENDKLQSQIQDKIKTIENVIDMLDGIIAKDRTPSPPPMLPGTTMPPLATIPDPPAPPSPPSPGNDGGRAHRNPSRSPRPDGGADRDRTDSPSPERLKNEVLESMHARGKRKPTDKKQSDHSEGKKKKSPYNYVHYDPEVHWCGTCNVFPKTAREYLAHLHSEQHRSRTTVDEGSSEEHKKKAAPWRAQLDTDDTMVNPDAPSKRAPIRGLQFFVPATAWYCKLCNYWMGDLHCASWHLKSQTHADAYGKYIDGHKNYETDWMAERQTAFEKYGASAGKDALADGDIPAPPPPPTAEELRLAASGAPQSNDAFVGASSAFQILPKNSLQEHKGGAPFEVSSPALTAKDEPQPSSASKKSKKKKSRKEERKEKKKKKRTKKRKRAAASSSSSSSSSSSDSSDSESDSGSDRESKASDKNENPIHAAMRNILNAKEVNAREVMAAAAAVAAAAGKSSAPNEPGAAAAGAVGATKGEPSLGRQMDGGASSAGKKNGCIAGAAASIPAAPSASSAGTASNLAPSNASSQSVDDRKRNVREEERDRDREKDRDRDRDRDRDSRRSVDRRDRWGRRDSPDRYGGRDRDRDRGRRTDYRDYRDRRDRRRSRSRGRRSRSGSGGRRFRRRSYSRSRTPRSRSRSRSRTSRGGSRHRQIEKAVPNFPPEPKPTKAEKKAPKPFSRSDGGSSTSKKSKASSSSAGSKGSSTEKGSAPKKLPFIGRMPVFKKQQADNAKKEEAAAAAAVATVPTAEESNEAGAVLEQQTEMVSAQLHESMVGGFASDNATEAAAATLAMMQGQEGVYDPQQIAQTAGTDAYQYANLEMGETVTPQDMDLVSAEEQMGEAEMVVDQGESNAEDSTTLATDSALQEDPDAYVSADGQVPLPKDFQEALDIIYDGGDKPKRADVIAKEAAAAAAVRQQQPSRQRWCRIRTSNRVRWYREW
uniref:U1-type domain-containing protein n=1 Tax=Anopheles coluzzii TaxID=1518534 RepID=A0A8W7PLZ1_ANOCL